MMYLGVKGIKLVLVTGCYGVWTLKPYTVGGKTASYANRLH